MWKSCQKTTNPKYIIKIKGLRWYISIKSVTSLRNAAYHTKTSYIHASYTMSCAGLARRSCDGGGTHASAFSPLSPYPQHGKLFPDIAISKLSHPSATLFAPLDGLRRQKFCQPGSVLRTHRSSTFSCILKWRCGEKSRI